MKKILCLLLLVSSVTFSYDIIEEALRREGSKYKNKENDISSTPCKYILPYKVMSSGKDSNYRYCSFDNKTKNFHIITEWMFSTKEKTQFSFRYSLMTVCSTSSVVVKGYSGLNELVMVDTLSDDSPWKKIYNLDCP